MQSESLLNSGRSKSKDLNICKMKPEMSNNSRFSPTDSNECPANSNKSPANSNKSPANSNNSPADSNKSPANSNNIPANSNNSRLSPADSKNIPAESQNSPANSNNSRFTPADSNNSLFSLADSNNSRLSPVAINNSPSNSNNSPADSNNSRRDSKSSWITDDASSILESELLAARVSQEIYDAYHADRLFQQLLFKSSVEINPDPKTPEVSYTSLRISHNMKKKRRRNKSKYSDQTVGVELQDTPSHIMRHISKLKGGSKRNSKVEENFKDPVGNEAQKKKEEQIKSDKKASHSRLMSRLMTLAELQKRRTDDAKKNNVLHFYLHSKRIPVEDVNAYIRFRAPDNNKYPSRK